MISSLSNKTALVTGPLEASAARRHRSWDRRALTCSCTTRNGAVEAENVFNGNGGKADTARADLSMADGPHAFTAQVRKIVRTTGHPRRESGHVEGGFDRRHNSERLRHLFAVNRPRAVLSGAATCPHHGLRPHRPRVIARQHMPPSARSWLRSDERCARHPNETLRFRACRSRHTSQCRCAPASLRNTARIGSRPTSALSEPQACLP